MKESLLRIHIGHHFYGTGNIGDDMMMAGFLSAIGERNAQVALSCCILGDCDSQRLRFPAVEWMPATRENVNACIARCDAWVGLGDTPFQSAGAEWLLGFLAMQADLCEQYGKPMYFLGVGVHDLAVLRNPDVARLLRTAVATWTRDSLSHAVLAPLAPGRVHEGGDLATIYLSARGWPSVPQQPRKLGLTLNFEGAARYDEVSLREICAAWTPSGSIHWLMQEVRSLPGSEAESYANLADDLRACIRLEQPGYRQAPTVDALVDAWPIVSHVITSRYHAGLAHAWRGARVVLIEREMKLRSLGLDLALQVAPDLRSAFAALERAEPAEPGRIARMRSLARNSVEASIDRWRATA